MYFDPNLLTAILYICPIQEQNFLFHQVPIFFSSNFLVYMINNDGKPGYKLKPEQVSTF